MGFVHTTLIAVVLAILVLFGGPGEAAAETVNTGVVSVSLGLPESIYQEDETTLLVTVASPPEAGVSADIEVMLSIETPSLVASPLDSSGLAVLTESGDLLPVKGPDSEFILARQTVMPSESYSWPLRLVTYTGALLGDYLFQVRVIEATTGKLLAVDEKVITVHAVIPRTPWLLDMDIGEAERELDSMKNILEWVGKELSRLAADQASIAVAEKDAYVREELGTLRGRYRYGEQRLQWFGEQITRLRHEGNVAPDEEEMYYDAAWSSSDEVWVPRWAIPWCYTPAETFETPFMLMPLEEIDPVRLSKLNDIKADLDAMVTDLAVLEQQIIWWQQEVPSWGGATLAWIEEAPERYRKHPGLWELPKAYWVYDPRSGQDAEKTLVWLARMLRGELFAVPTVSEMEVRRYSRFSKVLYDAWGKPFIVYLYAPDEMVKLVTDEVEAWPEIAGFTRYWGLYYFWMEGTGFFLTRQELPPLPGVFSNNWDGVKVLRWSEQGIPDLLLVFQTDGNNLAAMRAFFVEDGTLRMAQFSDGETKWEVQSLNQDALHRLGGGTFTTLLWRGSGARSVWRFSPDNYLIMLEKEMPGWMSWVKEIRFTAGDTKVEVEEWAWPGSSEMGTEEQVYEFTARPFIVDGHLMVPLEFLERVGLWKRDTSSWDPNRREVKLKLDPFDMLYHEVGIRIGRKHAVGTRNDGTTVELAIIPPPRIDDGTTMVPVRFLAEILGTGLNVDWDAKTKTAIIH